MRYKTTIEIVTEAADKNEAMEIAGEYLSGNLMSEVNMKCRARPVSYYATKKVVSVVAITLVIAFNVLITMQVKPTHNVNQRTVSIDAIQPPLKTSIANEKDSKFKKEWQDLQVKEALNSLKK